MSSNQQFWPSEVEAVRAWRHGHPDEPYRPAGTDYYVTVKYTNGDSATLSNTDPNAMRQVLLAQLAALDAIDPARGGMDRCDAQWPPKPEEAEEGSS